MVKSVSISPNNEEFLLPTDADFMAENAKLANIIAEQKILGREIVVVMGVGFVGAVMAAIVADSTNEEGKCSKFVIGMQRPSVRSYWKIPLINRGECPIKAEDPEVAPMIRRCVLEKKTLIAEIGQLSTRLC